MSLSFSEYPEHAQHLIQAALKAADPAIAVRQHLRRDGRYLTLHNQTFNLDSGNVYLISIGKAAVPMAVAVADILGTDLVTGIVVTKKSPRDWRETLGTHPLSLLLGGHPLPDEHSLQAATAVARLLETTTAQDLVIFLISGGASAIFSQPLIPLPDWQQLHRALLGSGCNINELNVIRRQLDQMKGGGLAALAGAATCYSLVLSDVIGNSLATIGSGLTVPSFDTAAQATAILERYDIASQLETAVYEQIQQVLHNTSDTDIVTPTVHHQIIADINRAAWAVHTCAARLGFLPQVLTTHLEGEARELGRLLAAIGKGLPPGYALILGGETTVTLRGDGLGGRNTEAALAAAIALDGWEDIVVITFATDGDDGPTNAAGAIITGQTARNGRLQGLNPRPFLANNDSFTYLQQLDNGRLALNDQDETTAQYPAHLIQTGPTGTNVNDLIIILTYPHLDG